MMVKSVKSLQCVFGKLIDKLLEKRDPVTTRYHTGYLDLGCKGIVTQVPLVACRQ